MKIEMDELKKLNYDKGVELLKQSGYYESGSGAPDGVEARTLKKGDNFLTDIYYALDNENGDELHTVSFVQEWEKGETIEEDILIKEYWNEL